MKVILASDVKDLGKKGSVVEVPDGYARNYLIPRGLVVEANAANLNIVKNKKDAENAKHEKDVAKAKELANKLRNIKLVIKTKAGDTGKLFGAITNKDISDKLKKDYKIDIDKKKIILSDTIKILGKFEIEIKLFPGISEKINLLVDRE